MKKLWGEKKELNGENWINEIINYYLANPIKQNNNQPSHPNTEPQNQEQPNQPTSPPTQTPHPTPNQSPKQKETNQEKQDQPILSSPFI